MDRETWMNGKKRDGDGQIWTNGKKRDEDRL